MITTRKGYLITVFRSKSWKSSFLVVMIINFINLSVNFAENDKDLEDPVDTVSEMIFEWCLDGDSEAIPDNGTEQKDQHLKPIKIFFISSFEFLWIVKTPFSIQPEITYLSHYTPVFLSLCSPPPDLG